MINGWVNCIYGLFLFIVIQDNFDWALLLGQIDLGPHIKHGMAILVIEIFAKLNALIQMVLLSQGNRLNGPIVPSFVMGNC